MEFDVAPRPLPQRGWRRAAMVAIGAIAIVAVALVTADTPVAPADGSPAALAGRTEAPTPTSMPTFATRATGTPIGRPVLPAQDAIVCRNLDQVSCGQVARASIAVLTMADGFVTRVSVARSILCDDDRACSSTKLAGSQPLGSAVVSLSSGAQAWVNVVEPAPDTGRVWEPARTTAWVVRWVP